VRSRAREEGQEYLYVVFYQNEATTYRAKEPEFTRFDESVN
jgi:hypothetical protein